MENLNTPIASVNTDHPMDQMYSIRIIHSRSNEKTKFFESIPEPGGYPKLGEVNKYDSIPAFLRVDADVLQAIVDAAAKAGFLPEKMETLEEEKKLLERIIESEKSEVLFNRKIVERLLDKTNVPNFD